MQSRLGLQRSPRAARVLTLAVVLVCGWGVMQVAPRGSVAGDERAKAGTSAYIGAADCKSCHPREYDAWERSGHARTFERARVGNLPPDVCEGRSVSHPPGATRFHARASDGVILAGTTGPDGVLTDYPLTHVTGTRRVRMYVTTLPDGRLQVLPAMNEAPTGKWFDYTHLIFGGPTGDGPPIVEPGDPSFWTGPVRSFGARCATCHTSGARPRAVLHGGSGPRATWRATGVDCEACHGPGRAHAEAWRGLRTDEPLVRLEKLAATDATALCLRCHMEGDVIGDPVQAGEDLFEHLDPTLLLSPERVDPAGRPLELIYDGLPFQTSRCAREGALRCSTCHAPHGSPHAGQLRWGPSNRQLCARCHESIATGVVKHSHHNVAGSGAACVSCHMPKLPIERGHGVITDHTIGLPMPFLKSDRVAQDACTWCHQHGLGAPSDAPRLDEDQLGEAFRRWWPDARGPAGWIQTLADARSGASDIAPALQALGEDASQPSVVRASAVRLLGRHGHKGADGVHAALSNSDSLIRRSAVRALGNLHTPRANAALRAATKDPSYAVRRAAALTALEDLRRVKQDRALLEAVLPILTEDCRRVPNDDQRWYRLGAARQLSGDLRGAIEAFERQAALDSLATGIRAHIAHLRKQLAKRR